MQKQVIKHIVQGKKPSVYIELPDDETFYVEGLVEFCAGLGYFSEEVSFNLFEYENQHFQIKMKHYYENKIERNSNVFIFYYDSFEGLSNLFLEEAMVYHSKAMSDLALVSYEKLEDLWSVNGTGRKKEAHTDQHLSFSINNYGPKNKEMLKALCYFAMRLGLYHTSISLPVINNANAHTQFEISIGEKNSLSLKGNNFFVLEGTIKALHIALLNISKEKHVSEGGDYAEWTNEISLLQQSSPWIVERWSEKSEASRLMERLKEVQEEYIDIYLTANFEQRQQYKKMIEQTYPKLKKVRVLAAFKTGYYWMVEEVLPSFPEKIEHILISCQTGNSKIGLELANRWIMEMYPIDEVISETYNIHVENIEFAIDERQKEIYCVFINGKKVDELSPLYNTFPYIDGVSAVSPVTAGYRTSNREVIIKSDRELFYNYYMDEVLPKLVSQLAFTEGAGISKPLFNQLKIHFTSSGIEEELAVKSELNSSFEALYEDLYFNSLDFFCILGKKKCGKPFHAPGGIVPYMHIQEDLFQDVAAEIEVERWIERTPTHNTVEGIEFDKNGDLKYIVHINGERAAYRNKTHRQSIWNETIQLWKDDPHVHLLHIENSYLGQPIPVIELTAPIQGEFYSGLKKSISKHTILIEAGHHANEVSSTPAVHRLVEYVIKEKPELLNNINLIFIPLANLDGDRLLRKLVVEHPKWKHHAARFNAVGLEFAYMKFYETEFGEANVVPNILKKWAPDIIIDNHGIPAHEWVQPFAGYTTPPLFPVSYNLPSAKIYGIGRYSDSEFAPIHRDNLAKLAKSIDHAFSDTQFATENMYWRNRYKKYGTTWVPEKYPIEEQENINFYQEIAVTPEYPSVTIFRYPSWVAADIISEVADEIVYGEELESCIEGQKRFNLAIIEHIAKVKSKIDSAPRWYKERPIKC